MLRQQNKHDALEQFLNSLLEDVIYKETTSIVIDVAKDIVNEHMEKAAAYDMIQDMIRQVIHEMGPDVVSTCLYLVYRDVCMYMNTHTYTQYSGAS